MVCVPRGSLKPCAQEPPQRRRESPCGGRGLRTLWNIPPFAPAAGYQHKPKLQPGRSLLTRADKRQEENSGLSRLLRKRDSVGPSLSSPQTMLGLSLREIESVSTRSRATDRGDKVAKEQNRVSRPCTVPLSSVPWGRLLGGTWHRATWDTCAHRLRACRAPIASRMAPVHLDGQPAEPPSPHGWHLCT